MSFLLLPGGAFEASVRWQQRFQCHDSEFRKAPAMSFRILAASVQPRGRVFAWLAATALVASLVAPEVQAQQAAPAPAPAAAPKAKKAAPKPAAAPAAPAPAQSAPPAAAPAAGT